VFFVLLCFGTAVGQVQKLGELSSGMFLDSSVIMEEDESDVFGYCLLYQLDRKSKEVFDLEYVILDKNLNKLTSFSLIQGVYKTWLARTRAELTFVKKIGNQLTIGVNDRIVKLGEYDLMPFFNYRFVNVNLDNFTFSKEFKYDKFTTKEYTYKEGDKMEISDFWDLQKLIKTKSSYFLAFATPEYNPKVEAINSMVTFDFKRQKSVNRFALLDKDMKIVWSKNINGDKKTACQYTYLDSDNDVLLIKKETLIKKVALEAKSIDVYNIKTGELLGEIKLEDELYDINLYSTSIVGDKIHVFTNTYENSKKGWNMGYGHLVFDKKTVAEGKRNFVLWKDLGKAIPGVKEHGAIGKDVGLMAQDFIITPKGTMLIVLEAYGVKANMQFATTSPKAYALLRDLYLIEFNDDNSIAFSKKLEKNNSVEVYPGISGLEMKKYGVFDYIFCQKINKSGDYVLFYTLNDQEGNKKKMAKKPLWTMGFVSNVGGEYGFETLPLYGDDLKIYPGLAKNGYIRLLEVNLKTNQAEMRLEKINY